MFIYNFKESKMPDISVFKDNINTELTMLKNQINMQLNNKEKIYQNFINLSIQTYLNLSNVTVLSDFNTAFALVDIILNELTILENKLNVLKDFVEATKFDDENFNQEDFLISLQYKLEDYYTTKNYAQQKNMEKEPVLNEAILKLGDYSYSYIATPPATNENKKQFVLLDSNNEIKENNNNNEDLDKIVKLSEVEEEFYGDSNNLKEELDGKKDNRILTISEKDNKVYLPYYITDLESILEENKNYNSIDEIIENKYIYPLDKYKSSILSRFKEAFKLIKEKEKGSFREALGLGFELMNNYKLHPAVIAACRNEDELDIYLDCLEENELDSFQIFDIKFEVPPAKIS